MSHIPGSPDWAAFAAWEDAQRRLPRDRDADLRWYDETLRLARLADPEWDSEARLRERAAYFAVIRERLSRAPRPR